MQEAAVQAFDVHGQQCVQKAAVISHIPNTGTRHAGNFTTTIACSPYSCYCEPWRLSAVPAPLLCAAQSRQPLQQGPASLRCTQAHLFRMPRCFCGAISRVSSPAACAGKPAFALDPVANQTCIPLAPNPPAPPAPSLSQLSGAGDKKKK